MPTEARRFFRDSCGTGTCDCWDDMVAAIGLVEEAFRRECECECEREVKKRRGRGRGMRSD